MIDGTAWPPLAVRIFQALTYLVTSVRAKVMETAFLYHKFSDLQSLGWGPGSNNF
jgi:hypothetical protein